MSPVKSRLVSGVPVRTIGRGKRGIRGQVNTNGTTTRFESNLERDLLILLDFDPTVAQVVGQPVTIPYANPKTGRISRYTPDFYVRHVGPDSREILYQVKYRADLWAAFWKMKPAWKEMQRIAREEGMSHRIITDAEIRPWMENAKFLHLYLRSTADLEIEDKLHEAMEVLGPAPVNLVLETAYCARDNRRIAIPHLWRMLATGAARADLRRPLTMYTPLTPAPEGEDAWQGPFSPL